MQKIIKRSDLLFGKKSTKLRNKVIAIVGVGGTGSTVVNLLSRVGLKKIIIIDGDFVDESNLERQTLYLKKDIKKPKVLAAKEKLKDFCNIEARPEFLDNKNIDFKGVDLVIDCTDCNFARLIINDYCKKNNIPWIYSGAIENIGAVYFNNPKGRCYQCFNKDKIGEKCISVGVTNAIVSLVGSLTASIALNFLVHNKKEKDLIRINLDNNSFEKIKIKKNKNCNACNKKFIYLYS